MKRIFLFLATNIAIVLVLSLTMRILGVEPYLNANGLNLTSLLIFAAVMGFGGSFISLAISKWMAKTSMGVQVITEPSTPQERWLVETVARYAQEAHIGMPEVGVFESHLHFEQTNSLHRIALVNQIKRFSHSLLCFFPIFVFKILFSLSDSQHSGFCFVSYDFFFFKKFSC